VDIEHFRATRARPAGREVPSLIAGRWAAKRASSGTPFHGRAAPGMIKSMVKDVLRKASWMRPTSLSVI